MSRCGYHEGCDEGLVQVVQEIGHLLLQVGGARRSLVDEVVQEVLDAKGRTLLLQGVGPWGKEGQKRVKHKVGSCLIVKNWCSFVHKAAFQDLLQT